MEPGTNMSKPCAECGGQVKRGILGAECRSCGFIVDGVRTSSPCLFGERVSGVNRCKSGSLPQDKAADVYLFRVGSLCSMDDRCPAFAENPSFVSSREKEAAFGQWCQYLADDGNCVQVVYKMDADGLFLVETARNVVVGVCPYKGNIRGQKECTIAAPDPSWPVPAWLPIDDFVKSASREVIAHWNDVREKALRLKDSGKVKMLRNDSNVVAATVQGDSGTYNVVLNRDDPDSWSISLWSCDCFAPDTLVTMGDGSLKPIVDVREGDLVMTHTGNVRPVVRAMSRPHDGELVAVKAFGIKTPVLVTPEHPFYVATKEHVRCESCSAVAVQRRPDLCTHSDKVAGFCESKDLVVGDTWLLTPSMVGSKQAPVFDMARFCLPLFVEDGRGCVRSSSNSGIRSRGRTGKGKGAWIPRFVEMDEDLAWLFGIFLAEGGLCKEGEFRFSLHADESEYAERIVRLLREKFSLSAKLKKRKTKCQDVVGYSSVVSEMFRTLLGNGHTGKSLDVSFMTMPVEIQQALVRGWHDGDAGCTVNSTLLSQMRLLLLRGGRVTGFSVASAEAQSNDLVGQNAGQCFKMSRVYWDAEPEKNYEIRRFVANGYQYSAVESTERVLYSGLVYNLEVEDEHTYIAGGFAVHNCGWGEWAFKRQVTYVGRMCSHAYATLMEAQSEKMRGPGSILWQNQYTAQAITPSFRDRVKSGIETVMGPVEGLTVRFSEHWSQRVVGEFSCVGQKFAYEYTQSTGRFTVRKTASISLSKDKVEPYTEKTATRFHTYTEQQELQNESVGLLARNISDIDTTGTHYRFGEDSTEETLEGLFW
jgi:hypothetical protein